MKTLLITLTFLLLSACGETVYIDAHGNRITELERRADLNDELDTLQSQLIDAITLGLNSLKDRVDMLEVDSFDLYQLLLQERQARESGDLALAAELQDEIALQNLANNLMQGQINSLNTNLSALSSQMSSLQTQVNNVEVSVSTIEAELDALSLSLANLQLALAAEVDNLQAQIDALSDRIDNEGVKVYACKRSNGTLSKERLFKIGGKFYGAMNYVTVQTVQTLANSTPITIAVPKLCVKDETEFKLPNNGGQCVPDSEWSVMEGTGIVQTIPQYSAVNTPVVTSVQIALEALNSGTNYITTDGSASCSFNGNGTNLQLIQ